MELLSLRCHTPMASYCYYYSRPGLPYIQCPIPPNHLNHLNGQVELLVYLGMRREVAESFTKEQARQAIPLKEAGLRDAAVVAITDLVATPEKRSTIRELSYRSAPPANFLSAQGSIAHLERNRNLAAREIACLRGAWATCVCPLQTSNDKTRYVRREYFLM